MQITEADRLDMLAELRRCHGERVGNIIVAHLPPVGWGDIARAHDIARLEQRIDTSDAARAHDIARLEQRIDASDAARAHDIARLEQRIDASDAARAHDIARLEQRIDASDAARAHDIARLDKRIDNLGSAMWAMGGITAAGFISMFTLVATKL